MINYSEIIQLIDYLGLLISSFIYALRFFLIEISTSVGAIIMHLEGCIMF